MTRFGVSLIMLLFLLSYVSALCNETQVDINSASAAELDKIIHIGNTTAWKIIDMRPFSSLDELVDVPYISVNYIKDIKAQGLACISSEEINSTNETEYQNQTINVQTPNNNSGIQEVINQTETIKKPITADVIKLNSQDTKDIKTNNNLLNSDNIAIYGLVTFSILLIFLFAIKKIKKPKTEFKE